MTDSIFSKFNFIKRLTSGGKPMSKKDKKQTQIQTLSSEGTSSTPCPDQVRELAYYKWEEACKKAEEAGEPRPNGDGAEYWLQAERELSEASEA